MIVVIAWIAVIPLALYALAVSNPSGAKSLVAEMKRRWRLHLIQKYGELEAEDIFEEFRLNMRKEGYPEEKIEDVIKSRREEVIDRLGTKAANNMLGEPTPLERYHRK